jgi:hypothetical protein
MKFVITLGFVFHFGLLGFSQYGDFGLAEQPTDDQIVDDLIFYGEENDMSGGYAVGDTVSDFTVYDHAGNSLNLYEELSGDKPVVLINGSVSCIRFRNAFNAEEGSQLYYAVGQFIEETQDLFNYIFVYGIEAHPTDGNCPSNCPNVILTDTTVTQAPDYGYRRGSLYSWTSAPEFNFPYSLYADNPDNAVYNNFFERPFGLLGIQCDGTVALRGDWVTEFLIGNSDQLEAWQSTYTSCTISWSEQEDESDEEDNETDDEGNDVGDENDDNSNDDSDEDSSGDSDGNDSGEDGDNDSGEDGDNDNSGEDSDGDDSDGDDSDGDDSDGDDSDGDDSDGDDSDDLLSDEVPHAFEGEFLGGSNTVFNHNQTKVSVYPNPVQNLLTIESSEIIEYFACFSLSGQKIQLAHHKTSPNLWRFDATNLKSGLYILRVNEKLVRVEVRH